MESSLIAVNGILRRSKEGRGCDQKGVGGQMATRENYTELKSTRRDVKPTYYFMMKCLLYSRMERVGVALHSDIERT